MARKSYRRRAMDRGSDASPSLEALMDRVRRTPPSSPARAAAIAAAATRAMIDGDPDVDFSARWLGIPPNVDPLPTPAGNRRLGLF